LAVIGIGAVNPASSQTSVQEASAEDAESTDGPAFGLTGDWFGLRTDLSARGIDIQLTQISEVMGVASGGIRRHAIADGRLQGDLNIDGNALLGLPGLTAHAQTWILQGGQGISRCCVGNIATISNIEARPSARLFTLWVQQSFLDDKASLRVGKLAADDEFAASSNSALFMNSAFGWPTFMGSNLPSGGPIFPLGGMGIRAKASLDGGWHVLGGVFAGDPAGSGTQDPLVVQDDGLYFGWTGGSFSILEVQFDPPEAEGEEPSNDRYHIGVWHHSGVFHDLGLDARGRSLADPSGTGLARRYGDNFGIYAMADVTLWAPRDDSGRKLSGFVTIGIQPEDRNPIAPFFSLGVNYRGLIPGRSEDVLGLAGSYLGQSGRLAQLERDRCRFESACGPIRDHEWLIEATYLAALTPRFGLQPNVQFIGHPGGHVALNGSTRAVPDALVYGLRTIIKL
jgi:porin